MIMKSTSFQRLWHMLTRVCHEIGKRSTYVYAQGKIWVAERQLRGATWHAGQRIVASWHATSWQTLPLHLKVLLGGLGAFILLLIIWKIPQWQAASWQGRIEPNDLAKLENDARTTLVQAVGGLALLLGLLFTWRNVRAIERTSQETLRISQEGQITERFTRAIDQLGSDKLQVCLGGIYALERIARDSETDHWPIMEVLTAYVRERVPWKEEEPRSTEETSPSEPQPPQNTQSPPKLATDIQAILTVLERRTRTYGKGEDQRLNLGNTDLRGADIQRAHLEEANLLRAHLEGATLREAHLEGAILREAHLEGAILLGVHLEGATLREAHLEGAILLGVHLERAILWEAHLEGAILQEAHLEGATLREAHLEGAGGLTVEQLAAVKTLYQAQLDPPFLEQIQRLYPQLLEKP
jgi:hypothetical protein